MNTFINNYIKNHTSNKLYKNDAMVRIRVDTGSPYGYLVSLEYKAMDINNDNIYFVITPTSRYYQPRTIYEYDIEKGKIKCNPSLFDPPYLYKYVKEYIDNNKDFIKMIVILKKHIYEYIS